MDKDITKYLLVAVVLTNYHRCYSDFTETSFSATTTENNKDLPYSEHPCRRICSNNSTAMTCYYKFTLEHYQTLSKACYNCPYNVDDCRRLHCIPGDGNKRPVAVVNRQMPGPSIEVCLGDEVVVDVENLLLGESTTIHWHGHHQRDTPYMDGVPFITQCPIQPTNTFRYTFWADNPGTHFWHSHTGFQRADGAFGSFIVRVPEDRDPHYKLYDFDLSSHVIIILDWGHELGMQKFVAHHHSNGDNKPANLLINGLGRFNQYKGGHDTLFTPTARFVVEKGYRYRFRVISAEFLNCPIELSIDNHTLMVISSDGSDFTPVQAESFISYAGERFDFVVTADQPQSLYWMRFKGLMDCDQRFNSAQQVAVLQYKGASDEDYPEANVSYASAHKEGVQVNALNKGMGEENLVNIAELHSLDPWDLSLKPTADHTFLISYDFYKIDNPHFHRRGLYSFKNVSDVKQQLLTPQLNHISMKLLAKPLLPERDQIDSSVFCNHTTVKNCVEDYCECTHVLQVPLNSVVELILIDKGFAYDANHPFHLHGYSFRVVGMEKVGNNVTVDTIRKLEKQGLIKRNLVDAPKKDTVTVPDGGYTVLRFHATNPGYWLFHCHIEFHIEIGMALVFKVGENEEMLPVPSGFPQCGNYQPNVQSYIECNSFSQKVKRLFVNSKNCNKSNANASHKHIFLFVLVVVLNIVEFG